MAVSKSLMLSITIPVFLPKKFVSKFNSLLIYQKSRNKLCFSCKIDSWIPEIMKKTGLVAVSMAAASATALSGASTSIRANIPQEDDVSRKKKEEKSATKTSSNPSDKFAPRFDGLRFIETLVTAHR